MIVKRSPREVLASKLAALVAESKGGSCERTQSVWAPSSPRTPHIGFSKRCVPVALSGVLLRSVAYEYPKNALHGAFKKTRRAARTTKFKRMSWRLAGIQDRKAEMGKFVPQSRQQVAPFKSRDVAWRSVSSAVNGVLRDARIASEVPAHPQASERASKQ